MERYVLVLSTGTGREFDNDIDSTIVNDKRYYRYCTTVYGMKTSYSYYCCDFDAEAWFLEAPPTPLPIPVAPIPVNCPSITGTHDIHNGTSKSYGMDEDGGHRAADNWGSFYANHSSGY